MKKLFLGVLIGATFALAGCGSTGQTTEAPAAQTESTAKTEATGNEADKEPETSAPEEEAEPATEEAKTASDQTASGNAPEEL
ncbi:MAG: peptide ABC transporter substrate-binding protein, partial [Lachnospiraceae bacterium]|nr:peptide ABC transporter substrate-binding protein [Lachnospiraceae bacterium]